MMIRRRILAWLGFSGWTAIALPGSRAAGFLASDCEAASMISGKVFGWAENQEALGGAKVQAFSDGDPGASTSSNDDGSFSLDVGAGRPVTLVFTKSGYANGVCALVVAPATVEVTLVKGSMTAETKRLLQRLFTF